MNKEELIEIGQEKIDKAVDTFQSKAIDVLEFLTWQFKNDFATDIDNNLNGYKRDFDKLQIEYAKTYMENDRLKAENRQLKSELEELKKKRANDVIRQEKDQRIAELEKEKEDLLKDYAFYKTKFYDKKRDCEMLQQVKNELEKEKQTAVKEFAEKLKCEMDFIPFIKGRDKEIEFDDVYNLINKLLKERGIE